MACLPYPCIYTTSCHFTNSKIPVSIALMARSSFFVFSYVKSVGAHCVFVYVRVRMVYGLGNIISHTDLQLEPLSSSTLSSCLLLSFLYVAVERIHTIFPRIHIELNSITTVNEWDSSECVCVCVYVCMYRVVLWRCWYVFKRKIEKRTNTADTHKHTHT